MASVRFLAELREALPQLRQNAVKQLAVCLAANGVAQLGEVGVIAPEDLVGFKKLSGNAQRGLLSLLEWPAGTAHGPRHHALWEGGDVGPARARWHDRRAVRGRALGGFLVRGVVRRFFQHVLVNVTATAGASQGTAQP